MLPDRSVLIGQKLVEMPKLKNSNGTFSVIFKQYEAAFSAIHCILSIDSIPDFQTLFCDPLSVAVIYVILAELG